YTGGTTINNGTLQINTPTSIVGNVTMTGGTGEAFAAGYPIDQAFLGRIANGPTANGSVSLGGNSSNNLDFSAATGANLANMRLGAAPGAFPGSIITYSGTLTPFSVGGTTPT